ncbi:MAG: DUF4397 domain-containing protein [Candidatus Kapabacteria bacterium]|nr:DUF4397 domain-containing protein [Candidatus Kapabacteria bacterium]
MKFAKMIFLGMLTLAVPFFTMSCSDDTTTPSPAAQANVMVVHASPNAPSVILTIDGKDINTAATAYPYLANTSYLKVDAGSRNIQVLVASNRGVAINAPGVALAANKNYTIFAVDSVSKITPLVVEDDLTTPAAGKAHVRFLHLSPNAPAVDIVVANTTTKLFSNRSFNKTATADDAAFKPVDAGTYNLSVRLASNGQEVLPLNGINLQAGKIYTVYAHGFAGGTGDAALNAKIITNN